MKFCLSLR